jgi:DNA-binding CsgD family transcriptional regulator
MSPANPCSRSRVFVPRLEGPTDAELGGVAVVAHSNKAGEASNSWVARQGLFTRSSVGPLRLADLPTEVLSGGMGSLRELAESEGFRTLTADLSARSRLIAGGSLINRFPLEAGQELDVVARWCLGTVASRWFEAAIRSRLRAVFDRDRLLVFTGPEDHDPVVWAALASLLSENPRPQIIWLVAEAAPTDPATTAENSTRSDEPAADIDDPARIGIFLALAPAGLRLADLVSLSGLPDHGVRAAVTVLNERGDVHTFGDQFLVIDAMRRDRLLGRVSNALAAGLLRSILRVLRSREVPASLLVESVDRSMTDERTRGMIIDSMRELADVSTGDAAELGLKAAEMFASDRDPALVALAHDLLPLLLRSGRKDDVRWLVTRVFRGRANPELEARAQLWEARADPVTATALDTVEDGLRIENASLAVRAELTALRFSFLSIRGETGAALMELGPAIESAAARSDSGLLSKLLSTQSQLHFAEGAMRSARSAAARAAEKRDASDPHESDWYAGETWRAQLLNYLGQTAAATDICARLIDATHRNRDVAPRSAVLALRAAISLAEGRLEQASSDAVESLEASFGRSLNTITTFDPSHHLAAGVLLRCSLLRGQNDTVHQVDRLLNPSPPSQRPSAQSLNDTRKLFIVDFLDDATGPDFSTVVNRLRVARAEGRLYPSAADPSEIVLLAHICKERQLEDLLSCLSDAVVDRGRRNPTEPVLHALSLHVTGIAQGEASLLGEAHNRWLEIGRPLLQADARWSAARVLATSQRAAALRFADEAHQLFATAGAERDAARVRHLSRRLGRTLVAASISAADDLGPLTRGEWAVVERAVRGETVHHIAADLFISAHTVTAHLRHVYVKLNINSRAELAGWRARRRSGE